VARNRARLEALAGTITDRTERSVQVAVADLGEAEGVRTVERLLYSEPAITMLVNNAGVGATAPILQSDVDGMEALIKLDVIALMRLAHAASIAFAARGHGTIINMASIVAIGPEILNGVYGGAKAFVVAFSQSLHHELADKGVRVQAVLPGAVATDFWDLAGTPVDQLPSGIVMSVDDVVDAALAGLDLGELITIPSLPDAGQWQVYDGARRAMFPNLSRSDPAERYRR
jgi:short-subunit dehydrogenase